MEGILNVIAKRANLIKTREDTKTNQVRDDLLGQIKEISLKITAIKSCFDLETNFDLIDSYILELDGLEKRYDYLIKQAKKQNVRAF